MRQAWEKYKEIFIILAYVAVVLGLFKLVAQPLFGQITEKRNYAEEKAADQEITQKKLKELPQLREKMEVVKKEGERLNVFFRQENALALIEEIEGLAVETGNEVEIEIIAEKNSTGNGGAKKANGQEKSASIKGDLPAKDFLAMKLRLDGDFNGAMRFVRKMENMDYFSDIVSLKISKVEKANDKEGVSGASIFQGATVSASEQNPAPDTAGYENPLDIVLEVIFYIEE